MENRSKHVYLHDLPPKKIKNSIFMFLVFTAAYIGLEIYFNLLLLQQMSDMTSAKEIDYIESFGKTLSGLGLAMLLMKFLLKKVESGGQFIGLFMLISMGTIALSFFIQGQIIKGIVNSGSDENKAKSMLITQASNTIVPYYDDKRFVAAEGEKLDPTEEKQRYLSLAQKCSAEQDTFLVNSPLEKALFPYHALNRPFTEDTFKKAAIAFNKCLLTDEHYFTTYVLNPTNKRLNDLYGKYEEMNQNYISEMGNLQEKLTKRRITRTTANRYKKEIENQWISGSRALFGSNSFVSPRLSKKKFFEHPDVKATVFEITNQKVFYKPDHPKIKSQFINDLPKTLFATYDKYRPHIQELNLDTDTKQVELSEKEQEEAKQAYKAIVMPMVALAFSLCFLLLNLVSIIGFMAFYKTPRINQVFMVIGMSCLIALPVYAKKQPEAENMLQDSSSSTNRLMIRTVVYYQKIVMKIYS